MFLDSVSILDLCPYVDRKAEVLELILPFLQFTCRRLRWEALWWQSWGVVGQLVGVSWGKVVRSLGEYTTLVR